MWKSCILRLIDLTRLARYRSEVSEIRTSSELRVSLREFVNRHKILALSFVQTSTVLVENSYTSKLGTPHNLPDFSKSSIILLMICQFTTYQWQAESILFTMNLMVMKRSDQAQVITILLIWNALFNSKPNTNCCKIWLWIAGLL